ncbi:magnesium-translocating P-type ATPase [Streptosporangium roseum]|uniref:magnesium-translocating P-type ATPase n=1 Tax=Streptosporangium roseum TaxID=2001 RepID=UPI00069166C3|nr:magnesium-translocating P-type ATPase [Streptosporangium roseum]
MKTAVHAPPGAAHLMGLSAGEAAMLPAVQVLDRLGVTEAGLSGAEATRRLAICGPNAVRAHHARALRVLGRQLRNAVLVLLAVTAVVSFFLGDSTNAVIIGVILVASVGLGSVNEYRAERAAQALHSQVRHTAVVLRDARPAEVDVTALVPGDVVRLALGGIVPADLRLLTTTGLECDESVLTGESLPVDKTVAPVPSGVAAAGPACCALMGTVVRAGSGTGVVVATGGRAAFGRIALGLGQRQPETGFQAGLRHFSVLLLQIAITLTSLILVTNLVLHRPLIESLLFSLAIAVGITPQLLPAVVSTSLAAGSRRLARCKVLVKRLVCIEDLGDMDVLVTDKTGTLTEGRIGFVAALAPGGDADDRVLLLGLLATESDLPTEAASAPEADLPAGDSVAVGGNPLDAALWQAPGAPAHLTGGYTRLGLLPFDHERRMTTAVLRAPDGTRVLITKGAPEAVLSRCPDVPAGAAGTLRDQFAAGSRVVAVASRPAAGLTVPTPADERDLILAGFLVFLDRPKEAAAASLRRLAALGITVKIATGDNPLVAGKVCADLGLTSGGTMTGTEIAALDDDALAAAAETTTIFARVSPEQKARLIRLLRRHGRDVGFLGDGVNDALALHAADVGISVDTATDVAKDAADVVLLEKDLGVLADGVAEGRRIFANTIKYVLMGTSSNFGNMFSAASASAVLSFLPMLPGQILLNNLLYDTSQLSIPTDHVDPEQLHAPSHWDIGFIRRFMFFFGPISSLFDFLTFAIMLGVFHAGPELFRSGWFVESLATQTLIIFAIRTRRIPFLRSRPSVPLLAAVLGVVAIGIALPLSPLSHALGFTALPPVFFLALTGMVIAYLIMVEFAKKVFFAGPVDRPLAVRRRDQVHHMQRRAARFSHPGPLPGRTGR